MVLGLFLLFILVEKSASQHRRRSLRSCPAQSLFLRFASSLQPSCTEHHAFISLGNHRFNTPLGEAVKPPLRYRRNVPQRHKSCIEQDSTAAKVTLNRETLKTSSKICNKEEQCYFHNFYSILTFNQCLTDPGSFADKILRIQWCFSLFPLSVIPPPASLHLSFSFSISQITHFRFTLQAKAQYFPR